MEIFFLPQDYLINATRKIGSIIESDVLLRALRIKNTNSEAVRIKKLLFDIRIKNKTVKQLVYPEEILENLTQTLVKNVKNFRGETAQIILGTEEFWDNECISPTPTLEPKQETGVLMEHFKIYQKEHIDECIVSVFYAQNSKERNSICKIPIIQYKNKNKYIFPLKGSWLVVNNYDNIHSHRCCHSEEFAIDLIRLTGDFIIAPEKKCDNRNYPSYGEKIYAVTDGEVVDCFNEFPENPPGLYSRLPEGNWNKLKEKYGFVTGLAGNYIILRHSGDEYSFYAHMIPGSLIIKQGDFVKQGQVIGLLGNSGNSDAPHLHFHLMNGKNILSSRGLPCFFSNIRDIANERLPFIEENNSIVNAE
jgi:hypothetical protein